MCTQFVVCLRWVYACTESCKKNRLHCPCPCWSFLLALIPSAGFSSIIVSGSFPVSWCMRLWETDLPYLMNFDDAFAWAFLKTIIGHLTFLRIITTYNLWILICFLNSCKKWSGRDEIDCDGKSTCPLTSQNAKEKPREWLILSFDDYYNCKLATLNKKPRATNSCIVFGIVRILEWCRSYQELTNMRIFWKFSR